MGKTDKLLQDIFDRRKEKKIKYSFITSLLKSLGAEVDES